MTFASKPEDGDAGAGSSPRGELGMATDLTLTEQKEQKLVVANQAEVDPTILGPQKRHSVVVSNQESRLSVPVPTNISDILQSGLATVAFLDDGMSANKENEDKTNLEVIVQPPLIFSGRPSPADFPQLDNSEAATQQNADELLQVKAAANLANGARPSQPPNPLPMESETGPRHQQHEGHESGGRGHEIDDDAPRKSAPAASISPETISTELDEERQSAGSNGKMAEVGNKKDL